MVEVLERRGAGNQCTRCGDGGQNSAICQWLIGGAAINFIDDYERGQILGIVSARHFSSSDIARS
jgi:hypothetical protein